MSTDLIEYRPFLNTDPPVLVEIWNFQPALRCLAAPITVDVLEQYVLSKPYFDQQGLIVAVDDSRGPCGFAHAGFSAGENRATLSRSVGAVSMVMTASDLDAPLENSVQKELLRRCEEYLSQCGASTAYAIGTWGVDPFYRGLYGGAVLSGVLTSDAARGALFRAAGYQEQCRRIVLQRKLAGFRPVVDRRQVQIRRGHTVEMMHDPTSDDWWSACVTGPAQVHKTILQVRGRGAPLGHALFWGLDPFSTNWAAPATGLIDLLTAAASRRQGLAAFLLGESLRQLQAQGLGVVETQVPASDLATLNLLKKLGFQPVDEAWELRKQLTP